MSLRQKPAGHRCPDCHTLFYEAESVVEHRGIEQGDCFKHLHKNAQIKILRYRDYYDIKPPPFPKDPDNFDVIDDE